MEEPIGNSGRAGRAAAPPAPWARGSAGCKGARMAAFRDQDLTTRYEERFEVEDSDEWIAVMAEYNREADAITAAVFRAQGEAGLAHFYLTDRRAFDRRLERGRQHFFGPPSGAHAAYLRSKGIID